VVSSKSSAVSARALPFSPVPEKNIGDLEPKLVISVVSAQAGIQEI
jgi:hypothetical protein